jgi:hypothetical protein
MGVRIDTIAFLNTVRSFGLLGQMSHQVVPLDPVHQEVVVLIDFIGRKPRSFICLDIYAKHPAAAFSMARYAGKVLKVLRR